MQRVWDCDYLPFSCSISLCPTESLEHFACPQQLRKRMETTQDQRSKKQIGSGDNKLDISQSMVPKHEIFSNWSTQVWLVKFWTTTLPYLHWNVQILIWWSGGSWDATAPWGPGTQEQQPCNDQQGEGHIPQHTQQRVRLLRLMHLRWNEWRNELHIGLPNHGMGNGLLHLWGLKQWCLKSFQKPQIRSRQRPIRFHHSKYTPCCGYLEDTIIWFGPTIGEGQYFMNNQHVFYWKWHFISLEYPGYFLEHTQMNHIVGCISHSIPIHIHCQLIKSC